MSKVPLCPQQAAGTRPDFQPVPQLLIAIEDAPPVPRPPDPPPPPPPRQGLRGLQATYGFGSWDFYWWATLARANSVEDSQYVQRTLAARSPIQSFTRWADPAEPSVLRGWYARLYDRAYVGLDGTANDVQMIQYVLTHGLVRQQTQGQIVWNETFAQQGYVQAQRVSPLYALEPAGTPLAFVGHSYGAAAAAVAYQILRQTGALPFDRLVTLGMPRVYTTMRPPYVQPSQALRFRNAGDPVPDLPPPFLVIAALQALLNASTPSNFAEYANPQPALSVLGAQGIAQTPDPSYELRDWIERTVRFVQAGGNVEPHFTRAYANAGRAWVNANLDSSWEGWANPTVLFTVNEELLNLGV